MDSSHESFTISSQQTLLPKQKQTKLKNLKTIIFFNILILFIIIAVSMIIPSIFNKKHRLWPEQLDPYTSGSSQFYCHLTPYPKLCYTSMSSMINTTALEQTPGPIFASSIQLAINELNNTTHSISKALSYYNNNTLLRPRRLSECEAVIHDSLSRLNRSLGLLGVDSDILALTYMEMDDFRALTIEATDNDGKCSLLLEEIDDVGVEEVKLGVEKANKLITNAIWLFEVRESILYDFYNPLVDNGDYHLYDYYFFDFEYRFLACLYSAMYLFLALLYFFFWNSY